jgi:hypothetical protein
MTNEEYANLMDEAVRSGMPSGGMAESVGGAIPKSKSWLAGKKKLGLGLFGGFLADRVLRTLDRSAELGIQRKAMRSQAELSSPENLYYQAAFPQAQQEEAEARQALMTHLSGGVIGPSIATGERLIGA